MTEPSSPLWRWARTSRRNAIWQTPFASFAARLLVGIAYRPLHVAARCEVNFEAYRSFDFPEPLPFEAPPSYNADLQTYERVPIKVEAASAQTLNGYCGVSFAY